jgi:hypothetical protein
MFKFKKCVDLNFEIRLNFGIRSDFKICSINKIPSKFDNRSNLFFIQIAKFSQILKFV